MPSYSATIQLSNGTLSVVRPHPSAEAADDLIDSALYAVRDPDTPITSVGITIVTEDDPTPGTPPLPDLTDGGTPSTVTGPLTA